MSNKFLIAITTGLALFTAAAPASAQEIDPRRFGGFIDLGIGHQTITFDGVEVSGLIEGASAGIRTDMPYIGMPGLNAIAGISGYGISRSGSGFNTAGQAVTHNVKGLAGDIFLGAEYDFGMFSVGALGTFGALPVETITTIAPGTIIADDRWVTHYGVRATGAAQLTDMAYAKAYAGISYGDVETFTFGGSIGAKF